MPIRSPSTALADSAVGSRRRAVDRAPPREDEAGLLRALTHDLRAHLTLLESAHSRLRSAADEPQRAAGWRQVDAALRQTRSFVDDLVELACTGEVQMEPTRVELGPAARRVLEEQGPLLDARGIAATAQTGAEAVWCHPARLLQVLTNLVRNAALHGCDPVDPRLSIGWTTLAETGEVCVQVADNGRGIPPSDRQRVFQAGGRVAGTSAPGSGMGLAIVRKVVEHYGGRVRIVPEHAPGTAIEFTLPTAAQRPSTRHARRG